MSNLLPKTRHLYRFFHLQQSIAINQKYFSSHTRCIPRHVNDCFHINRQIKRNFYRHYRTLSNFNRTLKYLAQTSPAQTVVQSHLCCNYSSTHGRYTLKNDKLKNYLEHLEAEFTELDGASRDRDQQERWRQLAVVVEPFRMAKSKYAELEELNEMEKDESLRGLAEEDKKACLELIAELEVSICDLLEGAADPHDGCDVILEVESGAGGVESMLFAHEIFTMYQQYAQFRGWSFTPIDQDAEQGTATAKMMRSASASISGSDVYRRMKYEAGVHRVKRVPVTESGGRVHTSTISVAVLAQPDKVEFELDPSEIRIDYTRAGGPGGQHAQKSNTAVRVKHLPTGITADIQTSRSQHQNEKLAMDLLKARILKFEENRSQSKIQSQRKMQVGRKERSERVRTYTYAINTITDHRTDKMYRQIKYVLSGQEGLDEVIEDLLEAADNESIDIKLDEYEQSQQSKTTNSKKAKS